MPSRSILRVNRRKVAQKISSVSTLYSPSDIHVDRSSYLFRIECNRLLATANLRTKIPDFRGFDSSIIFILRGGIPRPIGTLPESLSQAILVGIMLVGRWGVTRRLWRVSLSRGQVVSGARVSVYVDLQRHPGGALQKHSTHK